LLKRRRGSAWTRFKRIMAFAKRIGQSDPKSLHLLVTALGRVIQSQLILEPAMHGRDVADTIAFERFLLFDDSFPLDQEGRKLGDLLIPIDCPPRLELRSDIVLPWPWQESRLRNAMQGLRPGGDWGDWREDKNHQVTLWEPLKIGWVHGGNHSIAVGILLGSGSVVPQEAYDMSALYDYVICDGRTYQRKIDGTAISDVASIEMAAIFEIGRLIVANLRS
jgi:hypothetical protein